MKSATAFFERATAHHRAGRYADAEHDYLEILKANRQDADALRLLGVLYDQIGRPDRARECLEQAHRAQPENAEILNNLGVALRHCGQLEEAIARYEQSVALDPQYAQARANLVTALAERGNEFVREGQWNEAGIRFEKALRFDARNFRILNNLGGVRREQGRAEEACGLYREVLRLAPDYADAYVNLGNVLRDLGRLDEAIKNYEQALRMKPDSVGALNNLGTVLQDLDRVEEAVAQYDEALRIDPQSIDAKSNKAFTLLALGRYREGWELNETALGVKDKRGIALFSARAWDGCDFQGKRLLIWCEQGLGDNLQFVRYAALCKERGGTVIVLASKPLARLFANCPFIDETVTEARESDFDYQIAMMSLPHIFGTTLDTIPASVPYLYVDDETRAKWSAKFAGVDGFKIGLVWAGNSREHRADVHLIDKRRSISLSLMRPLLDVEGIHFYSLQFGKAAAQIDEFGLRSHMIDLMPDVKDMLDTAAIIQNLDLIISVDTSMAHLAGGLGKPVWILSRFDGCWRWLRNRADSPWYPAARIFGQPEPGNWNAVIENVSRALAANMKP